MKRSLFQRRSLRWDGLPIFTIRSNSSARRAKCTEFPGDPFDYFLSKSVNERSDEVLGLSVRRADVAPTMAHSPASMWRLDPHG